MTKERRQWIVGVILVGLTALATGADPVRAAERQEGLSAEASTLAEEGEATALREAERAEGDRHRGRQLFTGEIAFERGGAPCLACHGFDRIGPAGAASYGGDLTGLWENYGEEGVGSILVDLPFPSMAPIYDERPLTETERADLAAFFEASAGTEAPGTVAGFFVKSFVGAAFLFAGALVIGWRRLTSVRRSLVEKIPHSNS